MTLHQPSNAGICHAKASCGLLNQDRKLTNILGYLSKKSTDFAYFLRRRITQDQK